MLARLIFCVVLASLASAGSSAQNRITTPKEQFGFNFGDDYQLANYRQIAEYWRKLDGESDRIVLQEIGKTAEGRPHLMAIVTSPRNHQNLEKYKDISTRLALAEGISETVARQMAAEGKAVVWIDGGLHATETLGAQQLAEMVQQMASRTDAETQRFLDDCIVLFVHANPDGNDLVADWYMRQSAPELRSLTGLPRLYQKYIGHDNNRDFFASTQAETENINRVLYHDWLPQILYNHHQSGPAGTVVWSSPQRDPYNYNLDPLLILGLQALGTHLHQRLAAEGKPGATMASGGAYDGWWNGGIRNTGNFHNIIAILTETIGSPTPMRIPLVLQRQLPNRDLPYPIQPQEWRFRQSIDYSISFNRAVIDYASRNREHLLFNIWRMGQRAIQRGSEDTWTPSPTRVAAVGEKFGLASGRGGGSTSEVEAKAWTELRRPEYRDPRAYIIPASQPDFPTAVKFINALREVNVSVHRATADFTVAGTHYAAGSFVVFTAQAFRPHVLDMFEPQDHPNVIPYPGAPPTAPYDNAGWTLAYQMGVRFDRILEGFTGPFEKLTDWNVKPPPGTIGTMAGATAYSLSRATNDAFRAVNRLLARHETVTTGDGTFYFKASAATLKALQSVASELGLSFTPVRSAPRARPVRAPRIGLWDQYGGSMPSGWTRWILEQFEFSYSRVFAPDLDAGGLNTKYDVLVFVHGAIPQVPSTRPESNNPGPRAVRSELISIPPEYSRQLGRMSAEQTLPQIRQFLERGGTVIAIGSSSMNLATFLKLPVADQLTENGAPIPRSKYFVPGSILSARVDTRHPITAGMSERVDVFFDNSPVFKLLPDAGSGSAVVRTIATFDSPTPLRSGWAWGQRYLQGGIIALEAQVGSGRVYLFGPEILQRAQPHGTFKFFFNALVEARR